MSELMFRPIKPPRHHDFTPTLHEPSVCAECLRGKDVVWHDPVNTWRDFGELTPPEWGGHEIIIYTESKPRTSAECWDGLLVGVLLGMYLVFAILSAIELAFGK